MSVPERWPRWSGSSSGDSSRRGDGTSGGLARVGGEPISPSGARRAADPAGDASPHGSLRTTRPVDTQGPADRERACPKDFPDRGRRCSAVRGPSGPRAAAVAEHGRGLSGRPRAARHVPDEEPRPPSATAPYPLLRRFLAQQHTLGYARATIARRVGAIQTFYRWAVAAGRVETDPSLLLGRPKVVNRLPTVLRPHEAEVSREAPRRSPGDADPLSSTPSALRDRAVLELLYGSGLRVGEVAGLTVDRVDVQRGRVLVLGKGTKEREVPMSEYAADAMSDYLARRAARDGAPRRRVSCSSIGAGNPSVSATSVRWLSGMALPCCRGGM